MNLSGIEFSLPLILKSIVAFFDGLLYTIDAELYDLITKIANQTILSEGTLSDVANRVYQLVALIMVFRLIFLFLSYVVNPDDMLDKTKGYQNVIKKMIITLALIIVTPWAFTQARNVQQVILQEGVIEYLVFGQRSNTGATSGYEFMHTVGKLFVTPYKCTTADCSPTSGDVDNDDSQLCDSNWDKNIPITSDFGTMSCADMTSSVEGSVGGCEGKCGLGSNDKKYARELYKAAYAKGDKYDLQALMGLGGYGNNRAKSYYVEYKYPFIGTTLVGGVIGYMLIIICIDVAIRTIKLAFYQLMAPIPIVSYIGPKDGKESLLSKWFNQVLKTYGALFTRLAGLEIAVFFIDTMLKDNKLTESREFFVQLFLILGALTFAKQLPKLLEDLGIKFETGAFSLKKSLAPLAPVTGMAAGAIGGMAGNFAAGRQVNKGFLGGFKTAGQTLAGALGGAARGGMAGLKEKEGMGIKSGMTAGGRGAQKIYNREGTSFIGRHAAQIQNAVGAKTEGERIEDRVKTMETYAGYKKTLKDNADFYANAGAHYVDSSGTRRNLDLAGLGIDTSRLTATQAQAIDDQLKAKGVKGAKQYLEDLQHSGTATSQEIIAAREAYEKAQSFVIEHAHELKAEKRVQDASGAWHTSIVDGSAEQVQAIKEQAARYAHNHRATLSSQTDNAHATWEALNEGFIEASNRAVETRASEEYNRAQANKNWAQSGKSGKK